MITANELKTQGVKAIEKGLKKNKEVGISVRGKLKYVTMTIEQFEQIRLLELDNAYAEDKRDIEAGKYHTSVEKHFREIDKALTNV